MSKCHLTISEREIISQLHAQGHSSRKIAEQLGRSTSTISRELRRNKRANNTYSPSTAQHKYQQRRQGAKRPWKFLSAALKEYVLTKLTEHWSPEQIAGRLAIDFPSDESIRVSHETIYQWLYALKREGSDLYQSLRFSRKKRRTRRDAKSQRGMILQRKLIHERPSAVELKQEIGHWEGDTMEGQKGSGYLVTQVERVTGYTVIAAMKNKEAETLNTAAESSLKALPEVLKKTLTVDNGKEFAKHKELNKRTGMEVYFADPYSSWQRGLNENTNGLLRQYFPKGSDFRKLTRGQIERAMQELNHRPRKRLNWQTPHEMLMQHIVALQN
jgi:IS30 family transposase